MKVIGLDHVQLAMPPGGEAKAREFYYGLLGLREISKPDPIASRGGCWFEGPRTVVHLGVWEEFVPARMAHPAFLVSDLDQLLTKFEDAGIPTIPDESLPGVRRFYAEDPFGNRIEFIRDGDGFLGKNVPDVPPTA